MAPKRSRKDVDAATSSAVAYDKKVFVSKNAHKNYMLAVEKNKAWVQERGIDMNMHHPYPRLMHIIEKRHWMKFCEQPGPAVTSVVREFYANATESVNFMVKVRGVNVSYSAAAINAFYELPDIEDDAYSRSEDNLDPDAILRVVGSRGATWRFNENPHQLTMESKYMDYEMKTWHRFVGAKLLPTKHFASIDIHCANLIRALASQGCETINVGRVIQNSIMRSVQNTQLGFYHGHLITELCRCAGVRIRSNEEVLQPMHVIDRNTISTLR